jgi:hypothetical protein
MIIKGAMTLRENDTGERFGNVLIKQGLGHKPSRQSLNKLRCTGRNQHLAEKIGRDGH